MAALAEAGKLTCKEFGKTKIYVAVQEGLAELSAEEKVSKLQQIEELKARYKQEEESVSSLRKELAAMSSTLTVEEIQQEIAKLTTQTQELGAKLAALRGGATLVSSEEVAAVEAQVSQALDGWRRHKRIFMSIWHQVSENMDGKQADLFEEIGVDSDETIGVVLSEFQQLLGKQARR